MRPAIFFIVASCSGPRRALLPSVRALIGFPRRSSRHCTKTHRSDELENRALTRIAGYGVERRERRNGRRLGAQHAPAKMDGYGAAGVRVA